MHSTHPISSASTLRATLLVVLAATGFGTLSTLIVLGTERGGATLLSLLTWRYLLGGALLAVASVRAGLRVRPRRALLLVMLGGGGQTAISLLSLSALRYITAGTLGFLFYTYPAWVTLFAAVTRAERLTLGRLLALGLSLGGIVVIVGAPGASSMHPLGVSLALSSAVLYALYIPMIGRLQRGLPPQVAATYLTWGAAGVLIVLGVLSAVGGDLLRALLGTMHWTMTPIAWAATIGTAGFCTFVAFMAFLRGLAVLGSVRTAIISTVEPFWTSVLGWLVLGQRLTASTLAGGAMIAAAVWVLQRRAPRED